MPELPDVEHFRNTFESNGLNRTVDSTSVFDERILEEGLSPQGLGRKLKGRTFTATTRRGKYLLVRAERDSAPSWLVLHLGMTGSVAPVHDDPPEHTRVLLHFGNGGELAVVSQRLFGGVEVADDIDAFIAEKDLGPDALDNDLSADAFVEMTATRRGTLKSALMDQSLLSGIGNVYSNEVLFQLRYHPKTRMEDLTEDELRAVWRVMRRVLRTAIKHQPDVRSLPRSYILRQVARDEWECPECGGPIEKAAVSGRSAFYCPSCQRKHAP